MTNSEEKQINKIIETVIEEINVDHYHHLAEQMRNDPAHVLARFDN